MDSYAEIEFLKSIIFPLLVNLENVLVIRTVDEMGVLLTIKGIEQNEMGKIIGRQGTTASAIRTLIKQFGMGQEPRMRVNVKIEEPSGSNYPRPKYQNNHVHDNIDEEIKGI